MQGATVQKYPNIARESLRQEIVGIQATPGALPFLEFTILSVPSCKSMRQPAPRSSKPSCQVLYLQYTVSTLPM